MMGAKRVWTPFPRALPRGQRCGGLRVLYTARTTGLRVTASCFAQTVQLIYMYLHLVTLNGHPHALYTRCFTQRSGPAPPVFVCDLPRVCALFTWVWPVVYPSFTLLYRQLSPRLRVACSAFAQRLLLVCTGVRPGSQRLSTARVTRGRAQITFSVTPTKRCVRSQQGVNTA